MNIIDRINKYKENIPDIQIRYFSNKVIIFNIQTVSNSSLSNKYILEYLSKRNIFKNKFNLLKDLNRNIPSISFINIKEEDIMSYLFNGFTIIYYKKIFIAFETKANLDRAITEPTSEPTIKGPKDSFNENYNTNIGLIRKRIKCDKLYIKEIILGNKTNTKVAIMYMDDLVDKDLLNDVINKISNIRSDKILDSYYIKELIRKENKTSFPTIKSTEKPDVISKCLTEGKICIVTENSNNVLIIPTFFIDYFYYDEDNFQKPLFRVFAKGLRLFALFTTIFAPALYLSLITYDQQILPTSLLINFANQRSSVPFPAVMEAFILMITFEILYEADALTPISRGTSLSILGALVLGQAAVDAGIVSPIMVIVVAITAISSLFFTFFDFQSFIRTYRYLLMFLSSFFGIMGILFGLIILITNLCNINTFNKPFLLTNKKILNIKTNKEMIKKGLRVQNTKKTI